MKGQLDQIVKLNEAMGKSAGDEKFILSQIEMLREEFNEINNSTTDRERVKEYCDYIVVATGLLHLINIEEVSCQSEQIDFSFSLDECHRDIIRRYYENRNSSIFQVAAIGIAINCCINEIERRGYDAEKCLSLVNESNKTKLCYTSDEVADSITNWAKRGVKVDSVCHDGESIAILSAQTQEDDSGRIYPKFKMLKPPHYRPVDFSEFL